MDAGPAWTSWTTVSPVIAAPAPRERYLRATIPARISPDANGGYPSLRTIDEEGSEIPYAIDPPRAPGGQRRVAIIDSGFVEHHGSQGVLDLGEGNGIIDTVTLDIADTSPATFFESVAIDASDDRIHWRLGEQPSIVYRVQRDGRSDLTVGIAPTRSRWLRVRVLDPHAPFPIDGADVARNAGSGQSLGELPLPEAAFGSSSGTDSWTYDFEAPVRPAVLRFRDPPISFSRTAHISSSDDGRSWTSNGDGTIAHFADGGSALSLWIVPQTARFWRVSVDNGNDHTIEALQPILLAVQHTLVFDSRPGHRYRLLSGNVAAAAPVYDLATTLAHSSWTATAVVLGPPAANLTYRDPRPPGERFPWLTSLELIGIAAALGLVAWRTIRNAGAA